jgi:hypothetical protein
MGTIVDIDAIGVLVRVHDHDMAADMDRRMFRGRVLVLMHGRYDGLAIDAERVGMMTLSTILSRGRGSPALACTRARLSDLPGCLLVMPMVRHDGDGGPVASMMVHGNHAAADHVRAILLDPLGGLKFGGSNC